MMAGIVKKHCNNHMSALYSLQRMSSQIKVVAYKAKIPARSAIDTRSFVENNNLNYPGENDEGSLGDMHTQLNLLQVVDVEFDHCGNLSACLELCSRRCFEVVLFARSARLYVALWRKEGGLVFLLKGKPSECRVSSEKECVFKFGLPGERFKEGGSVPFLRVAGSLSSHPV